MSSPIKPPPPVFANANPARQGQQRRADAAGADFGEALANLGTTIVGQIIPGVLGAAGLGAGPIGLGGKAAGGVLGSDQIQLLRLQEEMQRRSQYFQTLSNISKTEHETKMNSIRNVKGG